jgi:hypothetical protein
MGGELTAGSAARRSAPPKPYGTTGDPTGRLGDSWTVEDNLMTDPDLGAVGELPMGEVGLPAFVGLLGAKRAPA